MRRSNLNAQVWESTVRIVKEDYLYYSAKLASCSGMQKLASLGFDLVSVSSESYSRSIEERYLH